MQKYTEIDPMKNVSDCSVDINNALKSLLSNNSGTAFPTSNLTEGMLCLRTDLDKLYQLKTINPLDWKMIADLTCGFSEALAKFLPLVGGVMSGNIQYKMYGSTQIPLKVYGGNSEGQSVSIGAGGLTVVGGGESKDLIESNVAIDEKLYLVSDKEIVLGTNLDAGWADRKESTFDRSGNLTVAGKVTAPTGFVGPLTGDVVGNATSAAIANTLGNGGGSGNGLVFSWSGQPGQPPWVWGGSDGKNMYVYNPALFSVNYASNAGKLNGYTYEQIVQKLTNGNVLYFASQTFVVPPFVTQVRVSGCANRGLTGKNASGNAGSPNAPSSPTHFYGGVGGLGARVYRRIINVTPGQSIIVTIGGLGNPSSFGPYLTLSAGGRGGDAWAGYWGDGANGGPGTNALPQEQGDGYSDAHFFIEWG